MSALGCGRRPEAARRGPGRPDAQLNNQVAYATSLRGLIAARRDEAQAAAVDAAIGLYLVAN